MAVSSPVKTEFRASIIALLPFINLPLVSKNIKLIVEEVIERSYLV